MAAAHVVSDAVGIPVMCDRQSIRLALPLGPIHSAKADRSQRRRRI